MRSNLVPCYFVPNTLPIFLFHMRTTLEGRCPGGKRLRRLFDLYKLTCDGHIEWTELGYEHVRSCIEAYAKASDGVIADDFRLLRLANLVFVYGERPSPMKELFGDLFGNLLEGMEGDAPMGGNQSS